jgi:hypothetical protein
MPEDAFVTLTESDLRTLPNGSLVLIRLAFTTLANDLDFDDADHELAQITADRCTQVLKARGH